jgi:hypothetical protein
VCKNEKTAQFPPCYPYRIPKQWFPASDLVKAPRFPMSAKTQESGVLAFLRLDKLIFTDSRVRCKSS